MALSLHDRVQETTVTAGTGTITLLGAVTGFQSFAVVGDANTCYYTIVDGSAWEVGIGTYSTSGPTLARTTVLSNSNGNTSPITLSSTDNTKTVFLTYPAEKSVNLDASGNVSALGTVASGTWQGTAVDAAYGGTGQTTYTDGQLLIGNSTGSTLAKATLTAGTGIDVTNGSGSITIANTGLTAYPGSGLAVSTGSAWGTSKTSPTGDIVGTTDSQTLTNKTIGMAGALDCNNNVIQEIKTATFNSQTTIATTTGAITVDWTSAQNQKQTEPTGTITYTFTAPSGPCHLQLIVDSDGTSTAQTINWPVTVVWYGLSYAGTNNKKSVINFWYDGTNYNATYMTQV